MLNLIPKLGEMRWLSRSVTAVQLRSPPRQPGMEIVGVSGSNIQVPSERGDLERCLKALSSALDSLNPCNKMSKCPDRLNIRWFVSADLSGRPFLHTVPLPD